MTEMSGQETKKTVLVADDEEQITAFIQTYLLREGYHVHTASNGLEALAQLERHPDTDLAILDWMMPGMNGLDVCRHIRKISDIPIIFLTSKSEEIDKLLGLEVGADDFVTKPFSIRELETRIRVILRRRNTPKPHPELLPGSEQNERQLVRGPLTIDLDKHKVAIDGQQVSLTPTEFKMLAALAEHPGRVHTRLALLESVLGEEYAGYERSIDTHIRNLRKKIEKDMANPVFILTVFGIGYKFGEIG